jgi:pyrroloquinoline quinone biosynthesis protein B
VVLTDAEIDHTAGLLILRESPQPLLVYSTDTVRQALTDAFPLLRVLEDYCGVIWSALKPGFSFNLENHGDACLAVEVFSLGAKPPKYKRAASPVKGDWVVGLTFRDPASGGVLTYAPGIAEWSPSLLERLATSDCILVDGTCWQDDELSELGISTRTARTMGHLPLAGTDGSLAHLAELFRPRKILVHINNTNPILRADSAARQAVEAAGVEVGYDGLTIEL